MFTVLIDDGKGPDPTHWRDEAACVGTDLDLWFPSVGEQVASHRVREALAICWACPVRTECADDALADPPSHDVAGIRGGMTHRQRARARRGEPWTPDPKRRMRIRRKDTR